MGSTGRCGSLRGRACWGWARRGWLGLLATGLVLPLAGWGQTLQRTGEPLEPHSVLWKTDVGEGLQRGTQAFGVGAGPGFGMSILGCSKAHDWGFAALQYGYVATDLLGEGHWYQGNLELGGELFGAGQYRPDRGFVVGGGPRLRYDLATGSRWMPFVQAGAGLAGTDIRNGDLSTTFEFSLQAGVGVHYFLRENLAVTAQYLFVHLSNAGLDQPNLGVNSSTFLLGVTCFF